MTTATFIWAGTPFVATMTEPLMIADTGHVRRAREALAKWIRENMAQDKEDKGDGKGKG